MLKSYYEILNISPDASKSEIKKQYKKLAKMYHPDINSSLEAEIRFKEINKAIEVLLDDEKRKNYDALRTVTKTIYKEAKQNKSENISPIQGEDITVNVKIDFQEAILGTYRVVNINHAALCPKCQGRKFANGIKCPVCDGLGEITQNRKITVKIPPSIKNHSKLRLKGEGHEGKYGGKNGNLYVIVEIEKSNDDLTINDGVVYYNKYISPYTAILGGDVKVATLWGEATIKLPPLTKSFQSFKLMDVGDMNEKNGKKGEEIVKIIIQIPSDLTDEEYRLYEKLREINLKKKNAGVI